MADKATTDDKAAQLRRDMQVRWLKNMKELPKIPKPEPTVEQDPYNSDDELPPPVHIPADFKPVYAWEQFKLPNNIQPKPALDMSDADLDFTLDSRKGQAAPMGISFCPFLAVTKYCYKFVPKNLMQMLATAFFDADKIWCRDWDLYYVSTSYGGVVTFVAEHQLQTLLNEINDVFPTAELKITDKQREEGLVIDFDDQPKERRPRFLGPCNSRAKHAAWVHQLETQPNMVIPDDGDRSIEAFKAKIDAAVALSKNKSKASKAKKQQHNVLTRLEMGKQSLRAQRFLGLIHKNQDTELPDISSLSISEPFDVAKPVPHPFDEEPIFISIDVEAYERPPRMVTEVGIATLDTRDLKNAAPGKNAQDWFKFIRGRHFRILEHLGKVNHEFVQGCPDAFEFGQSEKVPERSIASVIAACFREPFSKKSEDNEYPALGAAPSTTTEQETRNIVLVGHDVGQDIEYCKQIGINICNRGNIIDTADTVNMYRSYTKDPNARSLGSILYDFDIPGWHLHNAGNDAVYTLQAMLAICVQTAAGGKEAEELRERETRRKREETLVEDAKERAKNEGQGWETSSGEDGGVPVKPRDEDFRKEKKTFGPHKKQNGGGLYTMGGAPLDV